MSDLLTSSRRDVDIRSEYEKTYSERVLCLKNFYEMKHQTLLETIKSIYKKIIEDEVLCTMRKDATSGEFVAERIKEVFEEVVGGEREMMIERLGHQLTDLKSECGRLEGENIKLRTTIQALNDQLIAEKSSTDGLTRRLHEEVQTKRSQLTSELTERERENKELKYSVKQLEKETDMLRANLKEKDQELRAISHKAAESQSDNQQLAKRINELQLELQDLENAKIDQERQRQSIELQTRKTTGLLEDRIQDIERNSREMQEALKKHYKDKTAQYKKKIEEYKLRLNELAGLRSQKDRDQFAIVRTVSELETRVATLMQENDRKMAEYKNSRDKEKMELEKKHDWQLKEFQSHYEELLERKIQQVEEEASYHIQNMIEQEKQFKSFMDNKIQDYEAAYVRRSQHEDLQSEKQIHLERLKYQVEEKQQKIKQLTNKVSELEVLRTKVEKDMQDARDIIEQHDHILNEMKMKRRQLEDTLQTMANLDKKNRRNTIQLEEKVKNLTLQLDDKSRRLAKAATKITSQQNELKDLQFKNVTMKQELEDKETKIKQQLDEIRAGQKSNIDRQTQILQLNSRIEQVRKQQQASKDLIKKELQDKISLERQQTSQYKFSEQISKEIIGKLTTKCEEQVKRCQELSEKIIRLEWTVTNQKQKEKDLEEQIKKKLNQFIEKQRQFKSIAENFENQLKNKDEHINELEEILNIAELKEQRKMITTEKYASKLKGLSSSLRSMIKEITSVKDYISSMKKLQVSEFTLWISTLQRELQDKLRSKHIELISQQKKAAEQVRGQRLATEERLKTQFSQTVANHMQTIENLEEQVRSMKIENQLLTKTVENNKISMQQLSDKVSTSEKKVLQLDNLLSISEQKYKNTLKKLLIDFKEEKEQLIKEIEAKDRSYQEDFIELHKILKSLKYQSQVFKENLQLSKNKLNKDLDQATDRERLLQRQLKDKTQQKDMLEEKLATVSKDNSGLIDQINRLKQSQKIKNTEIVKLQAEVTAFQHKIGTLQIQIKKLSQTNSALEKETTSQKNQIQLIKEKNKRLDQQILQMHSIVGRTMRNADNENIRMAKILDSQTKQLTNKVKELKKISTYLGGKQGSTLRS